jgi:hypothetical protein
MQLGYTKREIISLLNDNLNDLNKVLENQINRMRQESVEPEMGLASLLTSALLSMLDGVSTVIELNNQKVVDDLIKLKILPPEHNISNN